MIQEEINEKVKKLNVLIGFLPFIFEDVYGRSGRGEIIR